MGTKDDPEMENEFDPLATYETVDVFMFRLAAIWLGLE
jgi:hypothetical protein